MDAETVLPMAKHGGVHHLRGGFGSCLPLDINIQKGPQALLKYETSKTCACEDICILIAEYVDVSLEHWLPAYRFMDEII